MTAKSATLGGNSLGLDPAEGPLMLILLASIWTNPADDARIIDVQRVLIDRIGEAARARKLDSRFTYLNYAFAGQDPIGGYGEQNVARLRTTSRKYDPDGFFQKAVPGGFKLFP